MQGELRMKSHIIPYIIAGFVLLLVLGAWGLWHFHVSCKRELELGMRQYGEVMGQLEKYTALRGAEVREKTAQPESLFAQVNQLGIELGLTRRLETLRPSGDGQKGNESLDLQLKALYLTEFLRFLQAVEALGNVTVERMSLVRSASRLLELEMRISRAFPS
mgnify:CR=1 FL=1